MKKYFVIFISLLITCFYDIKARDTFIFDFENNNVSINNDSVLIENKIMHFFSQIDKKDEFYICIKGKSINEGTVIFKITSQDGKILLYEEFPSYLLINYEFNGNFNSKNNKENFIKARIKAFFDEKYFKSPAIELDSVFDEDYSDKDIWNDIISDKTAIGFIYLIGEEDNRYVAFSNKRSKVIMYFNCC